MMDEIKDSTLGEEINRLQAEHRRYAQRLEELLEKPYLSEDEQLEEVRLKKLKLHAKDLIYALEHRAAVAV
ncbi:MAG TPA: YdcH family protein [Terracidiphilus sp.]|nr:YdcH family protein [Terracidiphilus sp.]